MSSPSSHRHEGPPVSDLAKLSNTRSNLGDEQNSAARLITLGGMLAACAATEQR